MEKSPDFFIDSIRSKGELAGVYEWDGDAAYFYLYGINKDAGKKILNSLHIYSGKPIFNDEDIVMKWDNKEEKVGLYILGELWAVFDVAEGRKYGGNYSLNRSPDIPKEILEEFLPKRSHPK